MKNFNKTIIKSTGIIFLTLSLSNLYQLYNDYITNSDYTLAINITLLFLGICLLETDNAFKSINRKIFYTNLFALIIGYISLVWISHTFWAPLLAWRIDTPSSTDLSFLFASIPLNNLSLYSIPECILKLLRMIYLSGFIAPLLLPIIASTLKANYKLAWQYFLSGHFLQILLITPFYLIFKVHEVWYITEQPDPLYRVFTSYNDMLFTVSWCFPSMHTSVAAASLLVALNEPYKLFRRAWISYCILVISSTMLLPIHWTLDVIGGIALAYVTTHLANMIISNEIIQYIIPDYQEKIKKTNDIVTTSN